MRWYLLASSLITVMGCTLEHGDNNTGRRPEAPITGGATCAGLEPILRSCGLLTAGPFTECEDPEDAEEQCQYGCVLVASCAEIRTLVCQEGEGLTGSLGQCFAACEPPPFDCGDGMTVPNGFVCDFSSDCFNGADEVDCGFHCAGSDLQVQQFQVCDGFLDCPEGDDEDDCSFDDGTFLCPGGFSISDAFVCDGFNDCGDNSDEQDCGDRPGAEFICE